MKGHTKLQKRWLGAHDRWTQEGRAALLREALAAAEGPGFDGSKFSPCMVWEPIVIDNPRLRVVSNIRVICLEPAGAAFVVHPLPPQPKPSDEGNESER